MKDRDFIDRSLSSHDAVSFVPDAVYYTLRKTLQNLHQYDRSAPSRGALRPADVASVEIEFHSSQKLAADRIYSAWLLMLSIARHRCLSGKRLQDLPPGQFAPLIAENHEMKQLELQRQRKNLEVLMKAEELLYDAISGYHVKEVFSFIGFVHNPAVREVIFKLHQHDFEVIPPETKEQCKTAFKGLGHSLGNERAFREIKDYKRRHSRKPVIKRVKRLNIPIQQKNNRYIL